MPTEPGLPWTDVSGSRLIAARLTTPGVLASSRATPGLAEPEVPAEPEGPAEPDPTP